MEDSLQKLRNEIDAIDSQLVELLAARFEVSKKIGREKKRQHQAIVDSTRESIIINKLIIKAEAQHLDTDLVAEIWLCIFAHSKRLQSLD